jgi:hypothetical protein
LKRVPDGRALGARGETLHHKCADFSGGRGRGADRARPARLSLLAGSVGSLAAGVGAVAGVVTDGFERHAAECTPGYGALAASGAPCAQVAGFADAPAEDDIRAAEPGTAALGACVSGHWTDGAIHKKNTPTPCGKGAGAYSASPAEGSAGSRARSTDAQPRQRPRVSRRARRRTARFRQLDPACLTTRVVLW